MKVTKVTAILRYSAETKGAWRSIEVGAEASLTSSDEGWETAQANLYYQLGQQLNRLWSNGNGKSEPRDLPLVESTPAPEHWCDLHNIEFQRQSKGGSVWYSHRVNNGWCNEPKG